jgi:hypothetical protein
MTSATSYPSVEDRLDYVVKNKLLPDTVMPTAERVLERLGRPLRIVIFGLPGSGKSEVLNLLAGRRLIENDVQLPTLQLEWGDEPSTICTLSDGSELTFKGADLEAAAEKSPVFVTLKTDLPALKKVSLLEVVAGKDPAEQKRAINWAVKRSDIALWCSDNFSPAEQALWAEVPDGLKDHGFLLLTKSDLRANDIETAAHQKLVRNTSDNEFHDTISLSAFQALEAQLDISGIDMPAFRASGAMGLIAAVKKQVEGGRRGDLDFAELTIAQYCADVDFGDEDGSADKKVAELVENNDAVLKSVLGTLPDEPAEMSASEDDAENASEAVAEPEDAETQDSVEPEAVDAQDAQPEADVAQDAAPEPEAPDTETDAEVQEAAETEPEPKPEPTGLSSADRALGDAALNVLAARTEDLATLFGGDQTPEPTAVLAHCEETAQDMLTALGDVKDPVLKQVVADTTESLDLMVLMQMEDGPGPADDAMTLLLQLKRDLNTRLLS